MSYVHTLIGGGGGTNPNLINNAWFTVNQRGITTKAHPDGANNISYDLDDWKFGGNSGVSTEVKVNSDGSVTHKVTSYTGSSSSSMRFNQGIEFPERLWGKTVTMSVIISSSQSTSPGKFYLGVYEATTVSYNTHPIKTVQIPSGITSDTLISATFVMPSGFTGNYTNLNFSIYGSNMRTAGDLITVKAVKLELGSVSTLANDVAPNYATELLKCQRYFIRYGATSLAQFVQDTCNATTFYANLWLPVPMRIKPTVTGGGTIDLWAGTNDTANATLTTLGSSADNNQNVTLRATGTFTNGKIYQLRLGANSYIELSAEL